MNLGQFIAPKGKRMVKKHRIHKPQSELSQVREKGSEKVRRMTETLVAGGWSFKYTIDIKSPRGFSYRATGKTGSEAFLKAFALWRAKDLPIPPPVVAPKPKPLNEQEVQRALWRKTMRNSCERKKLPRDNEFADLEPMLRHLKPALPELIKAVA